MITVFNKLVRITLTILSITAFNSYATPLLPNTYQNFDWTAVCDDCLGNEPLDITQGSNIVSGTLSLVDSYVIGESFNTSDFVSFSYNGPSNHVDPFTINNPSLNMPNTNIGWFLRTLHPVSGAINLDGSFRLDLGFSYEIYPNGEDFYLNVIETFTVDGESKEWSLSRDAESTYYSPDSGASRDYGSAFTILNLPQTSVP
ncbi:MAG: hypothetical protein JKX76_14730 [Colwellia sp.]|nr:hypothetical protein [Colwellia sp.]